MALWEGRVEQEQAMEQMEQPLQQSPTSWEQQAPPQGEEQALERR